MGPEIAPAPYGGLVGAAWNAVLFLDPCHRSTLVYERQSGHSEKFHHSAAIQPSRSFQTTTFNLYLQPMPLQSFHSAMNPVSNDLASSTSDGTNVCPYSSRAASSSIACPVAHGTPSSRQSLLARPLSKSPPTRSESNNVAEDTGCPMTLPDVSHDNNPLYDEFDNEAIYSDLRERVRYLTHYINFTEDDVEALNEFQPILLPLVDQLVDNVYHHIFKFDITKQVFMPRKGGQEGRMLSDLHDLELDAPQIIMRKKTFAVYMRKLVTSDYADFATWQYFDHVGVMHTGKDELKHRKLMGKAPIYVDVMHLCLTLGWTMDILTPVILSYPDYPLSRRIEIMRAFQKVIWIQNDLFTRHYAVRSTEVAGLKALRKGVNLSSPEAVNSELQLIQNLSTTSKDTSTTSSSGEGQSPRDDSTGIHPQRNFTGGGSPTSAQRDYAPTSNFPAAYPPLKEIKEKKSWFSFGR